MQQSCHILANRVPSFLVSCPTRWCLYWQRDGVQQCTPSFPAPAGMPSMANRGIFRMSIILKSTVRSVIVCYQSWQETIILQPPCTNNVFGGNQGKFRIDLQDYHQDKHFDYTAPGLSADAMFCLITDTLHWWWCGLEHDSGVLALQSLNMSLGGLLVIKKSIKGR